MPNTPQAGIFADLARCHRHLEYRLPEHIQAAQLLPLLQTLQQQPRSVIGFGHRAWQQLSNEQPAELKPFSDIDRAQSTQADLWLWVADDNHSVCLDNAMALHRALKGIGQLVLDIDGHQYHQSRDLSGFEDGSANPSTDQARRLAALIPEGQIGAGGSYVLTQNWRHNMEPLLALPLKEQEGIVGRTKADAIELQGDDMPANSHVSRTDLKIDGKALKMWRRSVPWGGVEKNGLYFVGFACELSRMEIMLEHMFGLTPDGIKDRFTNEFSTPINSSWWYAPTVEQLALISPR